ncbi:hypothetical protein ABZ845_07575 [Streptomyces sp. NPDC047022]|uniref:hypothetical protein n=1 Tax=Streptomyces sp. NPDC047022 TaxID=3155737 RepID=UPI0033CF8549
MRRPALAVLGLTTALPLALTLAACSSTSSGSSVSAPKPKHSASQDPDAGLATGAQLKKALAPASFFAKGFALEPSGSQDTGDTFTEQSSAPASAKPDCEKLDGTGWIDATGVSGVSFAQNDYVSKDTSEEIAQEIDAYRGTTAATVLKDLQDVVSACTAYTDSQTHTKVKVTGTATSGLGEEAYTVTLTDSGWQNGTTLIAARTGKNVISVMSTAGHDNGAATAKKLTEQILASMKNTA